MTATARKPGFNDYIVKDIGLAEFGRKEINIAETEMPGLMATRAEDRTGARCERPSRTSRPSDPRPQRGHR